MSGHEICWVSPDSGILPVAKLLKSDKNLTDIAYLGAINTVLGNIYHGYSRAWNMTITYLIIEHILVPMCHKLTHWGIVMPYGIGDCGQHWFR